MQAFNGVFAYCEKCNGRTAVAVRDEHPQLGWLYQIAQKESKSTSCCNAMHECMAGRKRRPYPRSGTVHLAEHIGRTHKIAMAYRSFGGAINFLSIHGEGSDCLMSENLSQAGGYAIKVASFQQVR